jgi:hypothetical protein
MVNKVDVVRMKVRSRTLLNSEDIRALLDEIDRLDFIAYGLYDAVGPANSEILDDILEEWRESDAVLRFSDVLADREFDLG